MDQSTRPVLDQFKQKRLVLDWFDLKVNQFNKIIQDWFWTSQKTSPVLDHFYKNKKTRQDLDQFRIIKNGFGPFSQKNYTKLFFWEIFGPFFFQKSLVVGRMDEWWV